MARITIEDCLDKVANRFDLVLLAAKRARQLASGRVEPTIPPGNDKYTVVALRELAAGTITAEMIEIIETQQVAGAERPSTQSFADEPMLYPAAGAHDLSADEDFIQH